MEHRRPWGWTDADYEMLDILFGEGLGNDEIAQAMDRTVSTVIQTLKRRGLHRGANNCLACGKVLDHPKTGRRRVYCGTQCSHAYRNNPSRAVVDAQPPRNAPPICQTCQSELTPDQIRRRLAKGLTLDYCCGTCRQGARTLVPSV